MPDVSGDWSKLGIGLNPTPGDPEVLDRVAEYMERMSGHVEVADEGLREVLRKSGEGAFVGKTADWLRKQINGNLQSFVAGMRLAFGTAAPAIRTYAGVMRETQQVSTSALASAAGLDAKADKARLDSLKSEVNGAKSDLASAAKKAAEAIRSATAQIRSPQSGCETFWEIFHWLTLAVTVVAVLVGGPLGLIALGMNVVEAAHYIQKFASGKGTLLEVALGLLGLVFPSTRPLRLDVLFKALWQGVKTGAAGVWKSFGAGVKGVWNVIRTLNVMGVINGIGDIAVTLGKTVKLNGLEVIKGFNAADGVFAKGVVLLKGMYLVPVKPLGLAVVPPIVRGLKGAWGGIAGAATWAWGGMKGFGGWSGKVWSAEFADLKWLRLFTPLAAHEIQALGVGGAFKVAVLGRGLNLSRYKVGDPMVQEILLAQKLGSGAVITDGVLTVKGGPPPLTSVHGPTGSPNVSGWSLTTTLRDLGGSRNTSGLSLNPVPQAPGAAPHLGESGAAPAFRGGGSPELILPFGTQPGAVVGGHLGTQPFHLPAGVDGSAIGKGTSWSPEVGAGTHFPSSVVDLSSLRSVPDSSGAFAPSVNSGIGSVTHLGGQLDQVRMQPFGTARNDGAGLHLDLPVSPRLQLDTSGAARGLDLGDFVSPELRQVLDATGLQVLSRSDSSVSVKFDVFEGAGSAPVGRTDTAQVPAGGAQVLDETGALGPALAKLDGFRPTELRALPGQATPRDAGNVASRPGSGADSHRSSVPAGTVSDDVGKGASRADSTSNALKLLAEAPEPPKPPVGLVEPPARPEGSAPGRVEDSTSARGRQGVDEAGAPGPPARLDLAGGDVTPRPLAAEPKPVGDPRPTSPQKPATNVSERHAQALDAHQQAAEDLKLAQKELADAESAAGPSDLSRGDYDFARLKKEVAVKHVVLDKTAANLDQVRRELGDVGQPQRLPDPEDAPQGVQLVKQHDPTSLPGQNGVDITLKPGAERVVDLRPGEQEGVVLAYHERLDGQEFTYRPGADGLWRSELQSEVRFQAELAALNGRSDLAEALTRIGDEGLDEVPLEQLTQLLHRGSLDETLAAVYEIIRRGSGKSLRWTQFDAIGAFGGRDFVQMSAGEGKSWVFFAHSVAEAVHSPGKAVQLITTRDSLALREFTEYQKLLEPHGIQVRQIQEDLPNLRPVDAEGAAVATVYVGTVSNLAFAKLKGNLVPGDRAFLDEVDEALVFSQGEFILAKGAGLQAPTKVMEGVRFARELLDDAVDAASLTLKHFGRTADTPKAPLRLNDEGLATMRELAGRELNALEVKRIEMAATAKWDYLADDHYLILDDRVLIIDQSTHKVMFDPEKASESRWHGDLKNGLPSLAQAIEAKHGLPIRADIESNARLNTGELFELTSRGGTYDHLTGASGTARGHEDVFGKFSSSGADVKVREIPDYYTSQLTGKDVFFPDEQSKLAALAEHVKVTWRGGEGPPQLIVATRNSEVAKISALLGDDVPHVAVDARWMADLRGRAEAEFTKITDKAGEVGQVLVVNMQGGRGTDIPLSPQALEKGGLQMSGTGRSMVSHDVDIQAIKRAGRSGAPGQYTIFNSADDVLFTDPRVRIAVVQFTDAHTALKNAEQARTVLTGTEAVDPTALAKVETELTRAQDQVASSELVLRALVPLLQPNHPDFRPDTESVHSAPVETVLDTPPPTLESVTDQSRPRPPPPDVIEQAETAWQYLDVVAGPVIVQAQDLFSRPGPQVPAPWWSEQVATLKADFIQKWEAIAPAPTAGQGEDLVGPVQAQRVLADDTVRRLAELRATAATLAEDPLTTARIRLEPVVLDVTDTDAVLGPPEALLRLEKLYAHLHPVAGDPELAGSWQPTSTQVDDLFRMYPTDGWSGLVEQVRSAGPGSTAFLQAFAEHATTASPLALHNLDGYVVLIDLRGPRAETAKTSPVSVPAPRLQDGLALKVLLVDATGRRQDPKELTPTSEESAAAGQQVRSELAHLLQALEESVAAKAKYRNLALARSKLAQGRQARALEVSGPARELSTVNGAGSGALASSMVEKPVSEAGVVGNIGGQGSGHVWVGGEYAGPAKTNGVREYRDLNEQNLHRFDRTDYLGNVRSDPQQRTGGVPDWDGMWVRFSPTGTNVIGEQHDAVTLRHVLNAVGGKNSFVYELIPADDLTAFPKTREAFVQMNRVVLRELGLSGRADLRPWGGESLLPKMGFAMTHVMSMLDTPPEADLGKYGSAGYIGRPVQDQVRIAWAYAHDLRSSTGSAPSDMASDRLKSVWTKAFSQLAPFMDSLEPGGYFGDSLRKWLASGVKVDQFRSALRSFVEAFTAVMRSRLISDVAVSKQERRELSTLNDQAFFINRREWSLRDTARKAVLKKVRYVGLGRQHLNANFLQAISSKEQVNKGRVQWYDLSETGAELQRFKNSTASLEREGTNLSPERVKFAREKAERDRLRNEGMQISEPYRTFGGGAKWVTVQLRGVANIEKVSWLLGELPGSLPRGSKIFLDLPNVGTNGAVKLAAAGDFDVVFRGPERNDLRRVDAERVNGTRRSGRVEAIVVNNHLGLPVLREEPRPIEVVQPTVTRIQIEAFDMTRTGLWRLGFGPMLPVEGWDRYVQQGTLETADVLDRRRQNVLFDSNLRDYAQREIRALVLQALAGVGTNSVALVRERGQERETLTVTMSSKESGQIDVSVTISGRQGRPGPGVQPPHGATEASWSGSTYDPSALDEYRPVTFLPRYGEPESQSGSSVGQMLNLTADGLRQLVPDAELRSQILGRMDDARIQQLYQEALETGGLATFSQRLQQELQPAPSVISDHPQRSGEGALPQPADWQSLLSPTAAPSALPSLQRPEHSPLSPITAEDGDEVIPPFSLPPAVSGEHLISSITDLVESDPFPWSEASPDQPQTSTETDWAQADVENNTAWQDVLRRGDEARSRRAAGRERRRLERAATEPAAATESGVATPAGAEILQPETQFDPITPVGDRFTPRPDDEPLANEAAAEKVFDSILSQWVSKYGHVSGADLEELRQSFSDAWAAELGRGKAPATEVQENLVELQLRCAEFLHELYSRVADSAAEGSFVGELPARDEIPPLAADDQPALSGWSSEAVERSFADASAGGDERVRTWFSDMQARAKVAVESGNWAVAFQAEMVARRMVARAVGNSTAPQDSLSDHQSALVQIVTAVLMADELVDADGEARDPERLPELAVHVQDWVNGLGLKSRQGVLGGAPPPATSGSSASPVNPALPLAPASRVNPPGTPSVFVGDQLVNPDDPQLTDAMRAWASDGVVRDYKSLAEFKAHTEGRTDHLGTLSNEDSSGTWMRLPASGTVILGENHTLTTAGDVEKAVGSRSFTHEMLPLDDLASKPATFAAYTRMYTTLLDGIGVARVPDEIREHGGESLYPKMGWAAERIHGSLERYDFATALDSTQHVGKSLQRLLNVAWAYAKEVRSGTFNFVPGRATSEQKLDLMAAAVLYRPELEEFISTLAPDGHLGDSLVAYRTAVGHQSFDQVFKPALSKFLEVFSAAMLDRLGKDSILSRQDRLEILSNESRETQLWTWRDISMLRQAERARKSNIRYLGMGFEHAKYVRTAQFLAKNPMDVVDLVSKVRHAEFNTERRAAVASKLNVPPAEQAGRDSDGEQEALRWSRGGLGQVLADLQLRPGPARDVWLQEAWADTKQVRAALRAGEPDATEARELAELMVKRAVGGSGGTVRFLTGDRRTTLVDVVTAAVLAEQGMVGEEAPTAADDVLQQVQGLVDDMVSLLDQREPGLPGGAPSGPLPVVQKKTVMILDPRIADDLAQLRLRPVSVPHGNFFDAVLISATARNIVLNAERDADALRRSAANHIAVNRSEFEGFFEAGFRNATDVYDLIDPHTKWSAKMHHAISLAVAEVAGVQLNIVKPDGTEWTLNEDAGGNAVVLVHTESGVSAKPDRYLATAPQQGEPSSWSMATQPATEPGLRLAEPSGSTEMSLLPPQDPESTPGTRSAAPGEWTTQPSSSQQIEPELPAESSDLGLADPTKFLPPWHFTEGRAFGDGRITDVDAVEKQALGSDALAWVAGVVATSGLKGSAAKKLQGRIVRVLKSPLKHDKPDTKYWERLLQQSVRVAHDDVQVELSFDVADVSYVPVVSKDNKYESAYGDMTVTHGNERRQDRSLGAHLAALIFPAAGWHAFTTLRVRAGFSQLVRWGTTTEAQSGNRALANERHAFKAVLVVRVAVSKSGEPQAVPGQNPLRLDGLELAFPKAFSVAETMERVGPESEQPQPQSVLPVVVVKVPAVLHGLDYTINSVKTHELLSKVRQELTKLLPANPAGVEELLQQIAKEFLNEKTMRDRSQYWLNNAWSSPVFSIEGFEGSLVAGATVKTVQYVETTSEAVPIRNDIADTFTAKDGKNYKSTAGLSLGFDIGLPKGDHLISPTVDLPSLKSSGLHGLSNSAQGQEKTAVMRFDRLVRYKAEFEFTFTLETTQIRHEFSSGALTELAMGVEHARRFEAEGLAGQDTGRPKSEDGGAARSWPPIQVQQGDTLELPRRRRDFPVQTVAGLRELKKLSRHSNGDPDRPGGKPHHVLTKPKPTDAKRPSARGGLRGRPKKRLVGGQLFTLEITTAQGFKPNRAWRALLAKSNVTHRPHPLPATGHGTEASRRDPGFLRYSVDQHGRVVTGLRAPLSTPSPSGPRKVHGLGGLLRLAGRPLRASSPPLPDHPFARARVTGPAQLRAIAAREPIEVDLAPDATVGDHDRATAWRDFVAQLPPGVRIVEPGGDDHPVGGRDQESSSSFAPARFRYVVDADGEIAGALRMQTVDQDSLGAVIWPQRYAGEFVPNPAAGRRTSIALQPVRSRGGLPATLTRDIQDGLKAELAKLYQVLDEDRAVQVRFTGEVPQPEPETFSAVLTQEQQTARDELARQVRFYQELRDVLPASEDVQVISADGSIESDLVRPPGHVLLPGASNPVTEGGDFGESAFRALSIDFRDGKVVVGPVKRAQRHQVDLAHREPPALAARKGLGPGVVREAAGLERVLPLVRQAMRHQLELAGATKEMRIGDWVHLERSLALHFSVPGVRGGFRALASGSTINYEYPVGNKVFQVALAADLLKMRGEPIKETGVSVDIQAKGATGVDIGEGRDWGAEIGANLHVRLRLLGITFLDFRIPELAAGVKWANALVGSNAAKEYRRRKIGGAGDAGPLTRFEYETEYTVTALTRYASSEQILSGMSTKLAGMTGVLVPDELLAPERLTLDQVQRIGEVTTSTSTRELSSDDDFLKRPDGSAAEPLALAPRQMNGILPTLHGMKELTDEIVALVERRTHEKPKRNAIMRFLLGPVKESNPAHDGVRSELTAHTPGNSRMGVAEEILRGTGPTFMQARSRQLVSEEGLSLPLPKTKDGYSQAVVIKLQPFDVVRENSSTKIVLEQYTEGDARHTHKKEHQFERSVGSSTTMVFRPGFKSAGHGEQQNHDTPVNSKQTGPQVTFGVGGGKSWATSLEEDATSGSLDLSLATFNGDPQNYPTHHYRGDAVYTLTHVQWKVHSYWNTFTHAKWKTLEFPKFRVKTSANVHVKVSGGIELGIPHVRALDLNLEVPPGYASKPTKPPGTELYLIDEDLGANAGTTDLVIADKVLPKIFEMLKRRKDLDSGWRSTSKVTAKFQALVSDRHPFRHGRDQVPSELKRAVIAMFEEESLRAYDGATGSTGLFMVIKTPTKIGGITRTTVRVTKSDQSTHSDWVRPRPDVKTTAGGQMFAQTAKATAKETVKRWKAHFGGRAGWGQGGRLPLDFSYAHESGFKVRNGEKSTTRDIRRATAAETGHEFSRKVTYRIDLFQSTDAPEVLHQLARPLNALTDEIKVALPVPAIEIVEHVRALKWWGETGQATSNLLDSEMVDGQVNFIVSSHLTTASAPTVKTPAKFKDVSATVSAHRDFRPVTAQQNELSKHLAIYMHAFSLPGSEQVFPWLKVAAGSTRGRVLDPGVKDDQQSGFDSQSLPGGIDNTVNALSFNERNLRANLAALLNGKLEIAGLRGKPMKVRLVPSNGRWTGRGGYASALNFPEHTVEPETEQESFSSGVFGFDFTGGRNAGGPIGTGHEATLINGGFDYDQQGQNRKKDQSNSTGEYHEQNLERKGTFDYYTFDVRYEVIGKKGVVVGGTIEGGLKGMVPADTVHHPDLERAPFDLDELGATAAVDIAYENQKTDNLGDLQDSIEAEESALYQAVSREITNAELAPEAPLRLWTKAEADAPMRTVAQRVATTLKRPVVLVDREPELGSTRFATFQPETAPEPGNVGSSLVAGMPDSSNHRRATWLGQASGPAVMR
jgi:hypothetical protein